MTDDRDVSAGDGEAAPGVPAYVSVVIEDASRAYLARLRSARGPRTHWSRPLTRDELDRQTEASIRP